MRIRSTIFVILLILVSMLYSQEVRPILTIDEAVKVALENNPDLRASQNEAVAAKWAVRNAYSAFLPKLSVNQRFTRYDQLTVDRANIAIDFIKDMPGMENVDIEPFMFENSHATSISVSMPIWNGGALISSAKISSRNKDIKDLNFTQKRLDVIFNARSSFLNYLKSAEYVKLQKKMVELFNKHLSSAKAMEKQGMITGTDLLRWEVQLTNANSELVSAENMERLAYIALLNTLGVELDNEYDLVPVSDDKVEEVREKFKTLEKTENISELKNWLGSVKNNNPQLLSVKKGTEIAGLGVGIAKSNFLPKINFAYSYGWYENNTLALDAFKNWNASIVMEIPIFQGFSDLFSYNEARYNLKAAKQQEKYVEDMVKTQTINALLNIKSSMFRLRFAEKGKAQSEKSISEMERKYDIGMLKTVDLIDAEVAFIQANINWINSKYDLLTASYELEKIMAEN